MKVFNAFVFIAFLYLLVVYITVDVWYFFFEELCSITFNKFYFPNYFMVFGRLLVIYVIVSGNYLSSSENCVVYVIMDFV